MENERAESLGWRNEETMEMARARQKRSEKERKNGREKREESARKSEKQKGRKGEERLP